MIVAGWPGILRAFKIIDSNTGCPRVCGQSHWYYLTKLPEGRLDRIGRRYRQYDAVLDGQSTSSESPKVDAVLDDYMATEGDPIWSVARMPEGTEAYTIDSPYVRLGSRNNTILNIDG